MTKTVSDCMHRLVSINRIKHLLDRKTLLLLINAFVFSKLFYCSTVWSNTSKTNIKKLQSLLNFTGRIVLGLRENDHISERLNSLRWLPVANKLLLNVSVMVLKCLNCRAPDYISQKIYTWTSSSRQKYTIQKRPESTGMQIKNWAGILGF